MSTHVGARRSEKHDKPEPDIEPIRDPEEDPRYPGMHTVIVPKMDARGAGYASPVGKYKGRGYTILSEEPEVTEHSDQVLMGIPIETWHKREEQRLADHNGMLSDGITRDFEQAVATKPGVTSARLVADKSGLAQRQKESLAEMGAGLPASTEGVE